MLHIHYTFVTHIHTCGWLFFEFCFCWQTGKWQPKLYRSYSSLFTLHVSTAGYLYEPCVRFKVEGVELNLVHLVRNIFKYAKCNWKQLQFYRSNSDFLSNIPNFAENSYISSKTVTFRLIFSLTFRRIFSLHNYKEKALSVKTLTSYSSATQRI